ncbi:hypothetical protein FCM35_KLT01647 [Carex littledalei]|uniref:Uncharacterized protein n=1 Tax=Carex littledalei TaxID=544730 RepID=A0A833VCJ0_9POAL|nr:hypothetical protein FCM35_KLT01647 [Carex littledalei]
MHESCSIKCPLKHLQSRKPWATPQRVTTGLFSSLDEWTPTNFMLSMVKYPSMAKPCARGARSNAPETYPILTPCARTTLR